MRLFSILLLLLITAAGCMGTSAFARTPDKRETIIFYPAYAVKTNGIWQALVHGKIYDPDEDSVTRGAVISLLEDKDVSADPEARAVYERRMRLFLVDNKRWKKIEIEAAGQRYTLPVSEANGHFQAEIQLPAGAGESGRISLRAVLPAGDNRVFEGQIFPAPENGLVVVSDIDDTIKVSDVRNKKELMRNTFMREFQATPGMPRFYEELAAKGALFFYVSASPWQLYTELAAFVKSAGYPQGLFVMKYFRAKDMSFFNLFMKPEEYKKESIEPLIRRFPNRRFVLIGDSGEKDPEAYADLARRYPDNVLGVFIRIAYDDESDRMARLTQGLRPGTFKTFKTPESAALLSGLCAREKLACR